MELEITAVELEITAMELEMKKTRTQAVAKIASVRLLLLSMAAMCS